MAGEARLRGTAGTVEHVVDVQGPALRRAQVAEGLDAVDELADPRRLGLDQPGQLAVGVAEPHLQQLRRPGDPRERVPDLVRKHRRHAGHRARRRAVAEAAVHLVGHALRMHQDQDLAVGVVQRRGVHVLQLRRLLAPADHQVVLRHRDAVAPRLPDHVEQRAVVADELAERPPGDLPQRHAAEALGGRVGGYDGVLGVDHQRRIGDRAPQRLEAAAAHAAIASGRSPRPRASASSTASGSVSAISRARSGPEPATPSRYQPRCLRAIRTPRSRP